MVKPPRLTEPSSRAHHPRQIFSGVFQPDILPPLAE
jgi:hypothetical protein